MGSLTVKLLTVALIAMFVITYVVLAREEAVIYRVGDHFEYRVKSKFIRVDGKEFMCMWTLKAIIKEISYPFVYLDLYWRLEQGDPEFCGNETATIEVRCRIDIRPEDPEFANHWEWPLLIDPQYSQVFRFEGGLIHKEVFEYKKGVLIKRTSTLPDIFGTYEVEMTLIDTSVDLNRFSILWVLAVLVLGAGVGVIAFKLAKSVLMRREAGQAT
ncbi:MAG: hypothetical protein QW065_03255 [Acidilobaceae archaeon]